jgi:hypothetical protein
MLKNINLVSGLNRQRFAQSEGLNITFSRFWKKRSKNTVIGGAN